MRIAVWGRGTFVAVALLSVIAIVFAHFLGNDRTAEIAGDAMFFAWLAAFVCDVLLGRAQR